MPKLRLHRDSWRGLAFAGIALFVIAADQLSKWWIRTNLDFGESFFDAGFFQVIHVQNTGAAFGIFQGYPQVFIAIDVIGIAVILLLALAFRGRWPLLGRMWVLAGLALLLGGTSGNFIDRLREGHVTDFLDFKVWPAFNVADASITVGVIVLAFCIVFLTRSSGNRP